jgi:hypothetical protein
MADNCCKSFLTNKFQFGWPPRRIWALRLEEVERAWSDRLSAAVASASSKVEDFKQRQSLDAAKAAEATALNAAEAESRYV